MHAVVLDPFRADDYFEHSLEGVRERSVAPRLAVLPREQRGVYPLDSGDGAANLLASELACGAHWVCAVPRLG